MFGIAIYLVLGWLVMWHRKPLHFAGAAAGGNCFAALLTGAGFVEILVGGVLSLLAFSAIYWLVARHADGVLLPIGILIGGGCLLGFVTFSL